MIDPTAIPLPDGGLSSLGKSQSRARSGPRAALRAIEDDVASWTCLRKGCRKKAPLWCSPEHRAADLADEAKKRRREG